MISVASIHGIGFGGLIAGYAYPLFLNLRVLHGLPTNDRPTPFSTHELYWRASVLGPLAWWALGFDGVMRRAQAGLDELAAQKKPVVLVTHSAGCRIAYDWFMRRGVPDPVVGWVSCGASQKILDGLAIPIGFKPAHVPRWVHCYREGDPFGGPLAAYGAHDRKMPMPLLAEHVDFWKDSEFAHEVMRMIRSVR